jgi:hypothetical protein
MIAYEVVHFRRHLQENDLENREYRRQFHENYEWIDGYCRSKWVTSGNNAIMVFCTKFGENYWDNIPQIPILAHELGHRGPIGSSRKPNYKSTKEVDLATKTLQHNEGSPVQQFRAMMILVRQIRNNLFHGMKMELSQPQIYERNKELVRLGAKITTVILDHLEDIG